MLLSAPSILFSEMSFLYSDAFSFLNEFHRVEFYRLTPGTVYDTEVSVVVGGHFSSVFVYPSFLPVLWLSFRRPTPTKTEVCGPLFTQWPSSLRQDSKNYQIPDKYKIVNTTYPLVWRWMSSTRYEPIW